ncbi:MAG: Maf-like protein [Hyphococcus sp.]|nr:MAG: Maf-like protein [Marinicaulis sp.]
MSKKPQIILASGSSIRRAILANAGLDFEVIRPDVDEGFIKKSAKDQGLSLEAVAMQLAEEKCMAVAKDTKGIVIGSDQILEFEDVAYDKPLDFGEARARLLAMQGKPHTLINAIAVARDGTIIWRNIDRPKLTMRTMSEAEIDAYLAACESDVLSSVGAYQVEKMGGRLFEKIEGDHYAVLGLSLFPLLALLRRVEAIDF